MSDTTQDEIPPCETIAIPHPDGSNEIVSFMFGPYFDNELTAIFACDTNGQHKFYRTRAPHYTQHETGSLERVCAKAAISLQIKSDYSDINIEDLLAVALQAFKLGLLEATNEDSLHIQFYVDTRGRSSMIYHLEQLEEITAEDFIRIMRAHHGKECIQKINNLETLIGLNTQDGNTSSFEAYNALKLRISDPQPDVN